MAKQILTQLSTHTVHLGTGNDQFEVTVNNLSDQFATFALELSASGLARQTIPDWYHLTPDLSAKIPAGDQVNFIVNILEAPPIPGGFNGKMNLNVNVTCLELGEEDRQLVNLVVAGSGVLSPTLKVPITDFQAAPGTLLEIPLQLYNPNRNMANMRVVLKGLPTHWLTDGHEKRLQVAPHSSVHGLFICQPPPASEAKVYPFLIEVSHAEAPSVQQAGTLTILPTGWIDFTCQASDPETPAAKDSKSKPIPANRYTLELNNQSNVYQSVALTLNRVDIPWHKKLWAAVRRQSPTPATTTAHLLHLSPTQVDLNVGDCAQMALTLRPKSPWLGWSRRQKFQLRSRLQQTEIQPSHHTLELCANPKIPFWVQGLAMAGLSIATLVSIIWSEGHRGPINSVQFDGQGNTIVSAADDHTLHRWQVMRQLKDIATLKDIDKAIRVVRYRPYNNNLLAAGLENGEIQLWDFLSQQSPKSLVFQKDDRVFDLQFSQDSQSLFSAHGSGLVLRWDINDLEALNQRTPPQQQQQFEFAIQAMASITPPQSTHHLLAVGGRFNQLILWNAKTGQQQPVAYPSGDPNHYLSSLDTADIDSTRLAAADNQGRITLWNLSKCLDSNGKLPCQVTDQWSDGHQGQPVNTVALSQNACYLASGGDDGRVMLWSLNPTGQVMEKKQLARFSKPVNSVDLIQKGKKLLIVSGNDRHQVKLHRARANNQACP